MAYTEYQSLRNVGRSNTDYPQYARLLDHIEDLRRELQDHILVCTSAEVVERLKILATNLGGNAMTK